MNSLDYTTIGEDFQKVLSTAGVDDKDLHNASASLLVIDAMVKYRTLKKITAFNLLTKTRLNSPHKAEPETKRELKDVMIRDKISRQIGRRFKELKGGNKDPGMKSLSAS